MQDVRGLGEYAWAEAVWRVLVEAVEEMQRKLEGHVSDVQMNGFSLLLQVPCEKFFFLNTWKLIVILDGA